jgi:hypothetical protein
LSEVISVERMNSRATGFRREKRRIRLLGDLVESRRQHAAEQPLEHRLTVRADGGLVARGHRAEDADGGAGGLGIGGDGIERIGVIRYAKSCRGRGDVAAGMSRSAT